MLMYNTIQTTMEFAFKMTAPCSYICTEDITGEENVRYIRNERHSSLAREQKGLECVTKIEPDMKATDLFNTYF